MTVAVVTDSAAALPRSLVAAHGIGVVPMYLTRKNESVREGEQTFDVIDDDGQVKTSGPTPGDFRRAIDAASSPDGVLVLTVASTMSGTYDAAIIGARDARERARVIDTGTAAGAEALVVLAAARASHRGSTLEEVEHAAVAAALEVHLLATIPSLDHLVRSGRVPNVAGWAGRKLGISPLFEFREGHARALRPALSVEAAHERMVAAVARSDPGRARLHVAALHSRAPEQAERLLAAASDSNVGDAFVASFGAVMEVHIGPGLTGLAWRWETAVA